MKEKEEEKMEDERRKEGEGNLLLALDVGNTNVSIGLFQGDRLAHKWRIQSDPKKTSDEYGIQLREIITSFGYRSDQLSGIIIGSVVPDLTHQMKALSRRYFHIEPLLVGQGTRIGINLRVDNPREVGADRILNAVAGYHYFGGPLIIVDIGTAVTHDILSDKGEYLGGTIAPGIGISSDALFYETAKLPKVPLDYPKSPIGSNTVDAMQSGIVYGFLGMVDSLTERLLEEMEKRGCPQPKVISTGGFSGLIASHSRYITAMEPDLTLQGLRLVYERSQGERD